MMDPKTNPECKEYFDKLNLDAEITPEIYRNAIVSAQKGRAMISYLVWKKMKEMYPEIDADAVMIATYREFGIINGKKWGNIENAKQSLLAQSSKSGYLVFQQELQAYSEDYAQKDFHFCPHIEAAKELGATPEEIKFFCQEILSAGDYGNMEPHPCVKLEFKKQIGAGDDHCEYCVSKIK
ncbi:MAG: L-2-amino-thiazoline-4-carboxylic acid hydrolase [Agathobaculum sp.]|jgi:hypothetical protein|uniref:L-2-amino-thiazoline-4-carboxylic acid hydrolase n=1 Tax=Agathobaculum sp. TaxID=2048138 RepID=UPI003D913C7F